MELSVAAQRVLGSLVEKAATTPDQYPLTVSALVAACNQRSARDPVLSLTETDVQQALRELREHDLARTSPVRGRVPRHEHTLHRQLDLDDAATTVLGVLLLRGAQTVGEIRSRTTRWHDFADLTAVEGTLVRLAQHVLLPLAEELPREPGRRESRWIHLLGADDGPPAPGPNQTIVHDPGGTSGDVAAGGDDLAARVTRLEREVARLRGLVGDHGQGPVDHHRHHHREAPVDGHGEGA